MTHCVLVLTACVNPMGMSYTVLSDPGQRKIQYVDALEYYLNETALPIVFVENTNCDFSSEFQPWIDEGRLEYLTFDGNRGFDRIKGKGYGEALMLIYAIKNSVFLKTCRYMVKVSGRIKVTNIVHICNSHWLRWFRHLWRCDVVGDETFATIVFVAAPNSVLQIMERHKEEITEENRGHNWIENIVARAYVADKLPPVRLLPFTFSPRFSAYSGTSNSKYIIKEDHVNAMDNYYYASRVERRKGNWGTSILFRWYYYAMVVVQKIVRS